MRAQTLAFLSLVTTSIAWPRFLQKRAPTIYLAGDSTMAENGGGNGTQGWGHYLQYSISGATVVNKAVAGRSARSYTREGRFQAIADVLQPGDYVVIEFGHNDGGSLSTTDNGRTDCPGSGSEVCYSVYNGVNETILTYPAYLINAGKMFVAKGAKVVISPLTPNNPWESGTFSYSPSRFTTYSKSAVASIGGSAAFVDHGQYTANIFNSLGASVVDSYFPNDHTHTSPQGATVVANAFVKGLACGGSPMANLIKNSTSSIQGSCI